MIYLGYLNIETANLYMENIVSHLLNAISKKFNELECEYTGYKLEFDKSYYKISLKFNDKSNYLENIIIPYLHNNAIFPVYQRKTNIKKPSIDLIYYKSSVYLGDKKDEIKIQVPTEKFKINHISLIKGTATRVRTGLPSLHDQMNLVEVNRYHYPLNGELKEI
jgi:hypothetical protein